LAVGREDVVRRHEVLRTSFAERDDLPVQVVGPPSPVSVPLVDLRVLPDASRLPEALRRCAELSRQPFDLACGPLLRASLLRLGGEEHLLSVVLHHIVCDAWSTGLLVREVAAVYSALGAGLAGANLPAPAVQYADFAIWQRHWLQGEALEAQLAYWRRRLAGPLRPLRLPRRRRPGTATLRSATVSAVLPATLLAQLQMLGRREGATLFMTLLAAFQGLLHRYSGQDDVAVGSPIANRNRIEIEPLIGFFTNTLVLRTDLAGNPSFRELLRRVREVALGAYAHQDVPFERLVEELRPPRQARATPFFDVMFVLLDAALPDTGPAGLALSLVATDHRAPKFDLTLWAEARRDRLQLSLTYDEDAFEASTVAGMLDRLSLLLARVAKDPRQALLDIPLDGVEGAGEAEELESTATPPPAERFAFEI